MLIVVVDVEFKNEIRPSYCKGLQINGGAFYIVPAHCFLGGDSWQFSVNGAQIDTDKFYFLRPNSTAIPKCMLPSKFDRKELQAKRSSDILLMGRLIANADSAALPPPPSNIDWQQAPFYVQGSNRVPLGPCSLGETVRCDPINVIETANALGHGFSGSLLLNAKGTALAILSGPDSGKLVFTRLGPVLRVLNASDVDGIGCNQTSASSSGLSSAAIFGVSIAVLVFICVCAHFVVPQKEQGKQDGNSDSNSDSDSDTPPAPPRPDKHSSTEVGQVLIVIKQGGDSNSDSDSDSDSDIPPPVPPRIDL